LHQVGTSSLLIVADCLADYKSVHNLKVPKSNSHVQRNVTADHASSPMESTVWRLLQ